MGSYFSDAIPIAMDRDYQQGFAKAARLLRVTHTLPQPPYGSDRSFAAGFLAAVSQEIKFRPLSDV